MHKKSLLNLQRTATRMYNIRHITVIFRKPISDKVEAKLLSDLQPVTGTVVYNYNEALPFRYFQL